MPEINVFLKLFQHKEGTPYAPGQTVFEAGTKGVSMFIVLDGEVEIRAGEAELAVLGPGSIFGEMALVDDEPRSATATAKTNCRLLEVDRRRFEFLVSETPFFALAVMRVMADRLRKANARIASL